MTDYDVERENNIIKNIAKEIVIEGMQNGIDVSKDLANYMVKLKLLNPKHGFTASEVMPRSLTQQLVMSVVEDLKQDTPAMNCIRLQVYWNSVNLNVADLKKEYHAEMNEKGEPYLLEILNLTADGDGNKIPKTAASYILVAQNLGNPNNIVSVKETMAAIYSVLKNREVTHFFTCTDEQKIEEIKQLAKKVTGIRLYLQMIGKGNEGIADARFLLPAIEYCKEDVQKYLDIVTERIEDIRVTICAVLSMDYFMSEGSETAEVSLPPDTDMSDLKYLKQVLAIMLQHSFYLSDIISKLEEIDGNSNFYLKQFEETLLKIQSTVRDREAVPTTEVYDDFIRTGELWLEIQSYFYVIEVVQGTIKTLEEINKKEHFFQTYLEKSVNVTLKPEPHNEGVRKSDVKSSGPSSILLLEQSEGLELEFRGFCAWTLFFGEGFLIPGNEHVGTYKINDQHLAFASKIAYDMWTKDPEYYLMQIYELLRTNPELVELLNAYDTLYSVKTIQLDKRVDRKVASKTEEVQTDLHPVTKFWDKDYTFSEWELKKRALTLSRLVKCVTKSVQTVNHSNYRASVGILAAPNKDKEVQTKRNTFTCHETVANYLYGLRGHRENKFKVIQLTRPVEENCEREIILQKGDTCKIFRKKKPRRRTLYTDVCPSWAVTDDECKHSVEPTTEYSFEFAGESLVNEGP